MKTEQVSISEVKPNPNNPRIIKDDKFAKLVQSIKDFPKMLEIRPIVVNADMIVLGGNMRLKACKEAGLKKVHIIKAEDLTEEQQREFIIKDNVSGGEWDWEQLANEWDVEQLDAWGLDVPDFTAEEIEPEEDDFDATPPIEAITVLGDLYEIGEHRLLCGDSTDSDQVAKLMNGQKADMVFTDPPYDLENEDYHSNIFIFTENAHVFVMHDDKGIVNYLRKSKLEFSRFYVANFGFSSPRGNDPYLSHILVSQEKNGNAIPHKNMYDGFRSIIPMEYRFRLKDDKTEHKHQKPISFIETFIKHFSNDSAKVLDLFLGSGSTMVASHQLKRKCYGMELDTKYCDVIVKRMIKLDPTLSVKRNGVDCKQEFVN
jgi:DNA modification methylase